MRGKYKRTEEHKRNLSKALIGRKVWNKGKKLHYPIWNKGKIFEQMIGNKNALGNKPNKTSFKKGHRYSIGTEFKVGQMSEKQKGENNSNWKGGFTKLKKFEKIAGRPRPSNCEVCGFEGKICFDHCHKTGKFRGWLCSKCNFALGNARDNPVILNALANYLKNAG